MDKTTPALVQAIAEATTQAHTNQHALRFKTAQFSKRLNAFCNSCENCNALLYVFKSGASGGGALHLQCGNPATPVEPKPANHSTRANVKKPKTLTLVQDNPRNACAFCGGGATLQTFCKHCAKQENTPQGTPPTRTPQGKRIFKPRLGGLYHSAKAIGKTSQFYVYASTQTATYTTPCGNVSHTRHIYMPEVITNKIDHVIAVHECEKCADYRCIAVLITPGNAY